MSWNYTVHQINRSFEQIALWYQDFLRRSENAFRALHERVSYLERQQAAQGPTDEQVERVLRKILAERFAPEGVRPVGDVEQSKNVQYFVKPPDPSSIPKPPLISPAKLAVDPEAVPSKVYGDTFRMLQEGLSEYPQVNVTTSSQKDTTSTDEPMTNPPDLAKTHGRPW
ncbi:hypothetical protein N0V90_013441 [Kalmusia sp. IMI 367209]|nr:hypothetical protein N0V90_013441 [Kalmusia sp. IMI 367209]